VTYRVRFTREAERDIVRLYQFILERDPGDWVLADRALDAVRHGIRGLEQSPFSYRKAPAGNPLLRELIIPFGSAGYVALFEIEGNDLVTVLAIRHQREDDYY
jgi:plasmid stabilization system protein ParE